MPVRTGWFFFSSRRRHTRSLCDWSPDVCSSDLELEQRFDERLEEPDDTSMRFAIELDDELIGDCGLHSIDHYRRSCHLGIALGREYWAKGLRSEERRVGKEGR